MLDIKDEGCENIGNDWSRPYITCKVLAFRTGWRGAWDAIKAAVTSNPRLQLPITLSFSMYVKTADVYNICLESGSESYNKAFNPAQDKSE